MTIIIYSIVMFIIFFLCAIFLCHFKIWKLVDIFYYPIMATGVLLFFFENEINREYATKSEQVTQLQVQLTEHEKVAPNIGSQYVSEAELVRSSGEYIKLISRFGEICGVISPIPAKCLIAQKLMPIVTPYEIMFRNYTSLEDKYNLCEAANRLFSEVYRKKIFGLFIARDIKDHFRVGLGMDFGQLAYNDTHNFIDKLKTDLQKNVAKTLQLAFKDNQHEKKSWRNTIKLRLNTAFNYLTRLSPAFDLRKIYVRDNTKIG